jgi:hypothetical protein
MNKATTFAFRGSVLSLSLASTLALAAGGASAATKTATTAKTVASPVSSGSATSASLPSAGVTSYRVVAAAKG